MIMVIKFIVLFKVCITLREEGLEKEMMREGEEEGEGTRQGDE